MFSSTFDAVVDAGAEEDAPPNAASALYDAAIAPAVAAAIDGRTGCVLCVGSGADKRQALVDAFAERGLPPLIAAAEDKGGSLAACALHLYWERLSDLLDGNRIIDGPPPAATGGGGGGPGCGLLGAATRTVTSPSDGASLLSSLPQAAAKAEEAAVGAAGGGHLVVQLSLLDSSGNSLGRLLLIDSADLQANGATSDLLAPTLCHSSAAMLQKALSKPAARPAAADATLLTRLLAPAFDHAASVTSRMVLNVTADSPQGTVDTLRTAQAAAKAGKAKAKGEAEARSGHVTEYLQKALADPKDPPSAEKVEELLKKAVGDASGLQSTLEATVVERNELDAALEKAKATGGGESAKSAEAEAEAQMAMWAEEEEALASQLAAERAEAEALMAVLKEAEANGGCAGDQAAVSKDALQEQVGKYEKAVESAWGDVQRAQKEAEETEARFDRAREYARQSAADKEEMESTLLDVAADLENLARNYRQHGSPAMAVPLYVSALAIFEKTLGPEHPQVASNLVNLGNAFCDQQKHIDAVPVYLRALAIDEKALGHDHPEVAMDLSNLGIAYRALGRADIASGLFERAHKLMLAAVGPDDPKTKAILRNLG